MLTLGIHDGHNASVCLMEDGHILYVLQEERMTREKNIAGMPFQSLQLLWDKTGLVPDAIDEIVFNGDTVGKPRGRLDVLAQYNSYFNTHATLFWKKRLSEIPFVYKAYERKVKGWRNENLKKAGFTNLSKIKYVDHHLAHAASAYYGNGNFSDDILVLTNDGAGDLLCATVSVGSKGKLKRIVSVNEKHSVGSVYAFFTFLFGMVPLEHEYKIMGMAPYASKSASKKIADELRSFFDISTDGLTWRFNKGRSVFEAAPFWRDFIHLKRFDHVMGGLQIFIEEFLVDWVKACIRKTGVRKLALAGGTFMNVKANKRIMELEDVESVFIFPSCGDESSSIGVCWYTQHEKYIDRFSLTNVYWGIYFDNDSIKKSFDEYSFTKKYKIDYVDDIESKVASLLAEHHVVGRFAGREEFGARSLGNRALLANPSNADVIKEINEMIKSRDFWMPFASSILDRRRGDYLLEMDKNDPLFMIMTFDSLPKAKEIVAGIHPYDKTVRPQVVTSSSNLRYHNLIHLFEQQTGIGGVLNTSLNLHGLPLVHTPEDAFLLLEKSSLRYLAIENYLVEKTD